MNKYKDLFFKQVIFHKAVNHLVIFNKTPINTNKEEGYTQIPLFYWYDPG